MGFKTHFVLSETSISGRALASGPVGPGIEPPPGHG